MKTTSIPVAALAAAIAFAGTAPAATMPQGHPLLLSAPANRIVGVWEYQVHVFACDTGTTLARFRASTLFNTGGTLVDTNSAPPGTRGPGLGTWTYDPVTRRHVAQMRLYRYDPATGAFIGATQVRRTLAMSADGNRSSGRFTGRLLGPNEEVLMQTCGEETGVRAL